MYFTLIVLFFFTNDIKQTEKRQHNKKRVKNS